VAGFLLSSKKHILRGELTKVSAKFMLSSPTDTIYPKGLPSATG